MRAAREAVRLSVAKDDSGGISSERVGVPRPELEGEQDREQATSR